MNLRQSKQGDTTTIDLQYSYENVKVTYNEDTIKRMINKLKNAKSETEGEIDKEYL